MKKIFTLILVLYACNLFGQEFTQAQIDSIIKLSTSTEEISPEFIDSNSILVVFKDSRKDVNKYLEKKLEKEYKGEYRLIEQGEGLDKKDTSKTRFFISIITRFNGGYGSGSTRVGPETVYQMIMTDRKTNKMFYFKESTSCYSCLFEAYFKKLEKLRTKTK